MNNNNTPFVIISVILIVVSIALFYFLVIPQFEKISVQETEISNLEYKLENTTNYFNEIKKNAEELEKIGWDGAAKKINANFMDGPFFVHNMEAYLKGLVARSGLYLKDLKIEGVSESFEVGKENSKASGEDKVKEVNVFLDLSGDYNYFRNLLDLFNGQALVIKISEIEINSGNDGGEFQSESVVTSYLNFKIKGNIPSK
ncbi:MAG: hypothetical protein PHU74_01090 [Candidatus Pacebacteria bacterium]|nr:hypothetical protein [Candidatus Paceibacterota bacterium]